GQVVAVRETAVGARFCLIDAAHATADQVEAGRAATGERSTFAYNYGYGFEVERSRDDLVHETLDRTEIVYPRPRVSVMRPTFEFVTEADRYGFVEQIELNSGTHRGMLVIPDPASAS